MQHQYKQEKQMKMTDRPVIKGDHKIFRVQNPIRSELALSMLFVLKYYIAYSIQKTAKAYPKTNIIYGKVGGSWWKPEYRIIIAGKIKKDVQDAAVMLQKSFSGRKNKKQQS